MDISNSMRHFNRKRMKSKNYKALNAVTYTKYLVGLTLIFLLSSCLRDINNWEGVWRTEIEYIPSLQSNYEFELSQGLFSGEWSGRWEAEELFGSGDIPEITIDELAVELNFGADGRFKGKLSNDKQTLEGIFYGLDGKLDSLKFDKVDEWTSEKPARTDEKGNALKKWSYKVPESIDDGWTTSDLKSSNIVQQTIINLFQKVVDGEYKGLDAVLISHKGKLVLEEYFHLGAQDRNHTIQSCTKSVTSLLVGIARDSSLIDNLDKPLQDFFSPEETLNTHTWPITLKHALTMSAGLDWNEWVIPYTNPNNIAVRMNSSEDMYSFVLNRKVEDKGILGNKFEYNSGLSVLLGGVINNVTGLPADKYAKRTLFKKLGIDNYYWASVTGQTHTGGGLFLRPRDFLKIGQLVLDNGKWEGQQVISESWIKESTAFNLPIEDSKDRGYGYQWWRSQFNVGTTKFPAISAEGYGGQLLFVVPDLELVVLFLHHNPKDFNLSHTMASKEMEEFIIPAVLVN